MNENVQQNKVTIGTASTLICPAKDRQELMIQNISDLTPGAQVVTLHIGQGDAKANEGIILRPGYSYVASNGDGFRVTQEDIYAVANAAGAVLAMFVR